MAADSTAARKRHLDDSPPSGGLSEGGAVATTHAQIHKRPRTDVKLAASMHPPTRVKMTEEQRRALESLSHTFAVTSDDSRSRSANTVTASVVHHKHSSSTRSNVPMGSSSSSVKASSASSVSLVNKNVKSTVGPPNGLSTAPHGDGGRDRHGVSQNSVPSLSYVASLLHLHDTSSGGSLSAPSLSNANNHGLVSTKPISSLEPQTPPRRKPAVPAAPHPHKQDTAAAARYRSSDGSVRYTSASPSYAPTSPVTRENSADSKDTAQSARSTVTSCLRPLIHTSKRTAVPSAATTAAAAATAIAGTHTTTKANAPRAAIKPCIMFDSDDLPEPSVTAQRARDTESMPQASSLSLATEPAPAHKIAPLMATGAMLHQQQMLQTANARQVMGKNIVLSLVRDTRLLSDLRRRILQGIGSETYYMPLPIAIDHSTLKTVIDFDYSLSYKSDGSRHYLLICRWGWFLSDRSFQIYHMSNVPADYDHMIRQTHPSIENSDDFILLDGEWQCLPLRENSALYVNAFQVHHAMRMRGTSWLAIPFKDVYVEFNKLVQDLNRLRQTPVAAPAAAAAASATSATSTASDAGASSVASTGATAVAEPLDRDTDVEMQPRSTAADDDTTNTAAPMQTDDTSHTDEKHTRDVAMSFLDGLAEPSASTAISTNWQQQQEGQAASAPEVHTEIPSFYLIGKQFANLDQMETEILTKLVKCNPERSSATTDFLYRDSALPFDIPCDGLFLQSKFALFDSRLNPIGQVKIKQRHTVDLLISERIDMHYVLWTQTCMIGKTICTSMDTETIKTINHELYNNRHPIAEFEYDRETSRWKLLRLRPEKRQPNALKTLLTCLLCTIDNIQIQTLLKKIHASKRTTRGRRKTATAASSSHSSKHVS